MVAQRFTTDNGILVGNQGNDVLFGDEADDTIYGGPGTNTMTGDGVADLFVTIISDHAPDRDAFVFAR